ncbi:MAG: histone H1 [Alphaproteobacteria bacterium]|nr:histone H1 [Alphaproteobacteria bacterium]
MAAKFNELRDAITEIEKDVNNFYNKGNKAAGTRVRKAMQTVKALAQEIRNEIQDIKNADS